VLVDPTGPAWKTDDRNFGLCCKTEPEDSLSEFSGIDMGDAQTSCPKISHDELDRI
jgi:hypothetical protein